VWDLGLRVEGVGFGVESAVFGVEGVGLGNFLQRRAEGGGCGI